LRAVGDEYGGECETYRQSEPRRGGGDQFTKHAEDSNHRLRRSANTICVICGSRLSTGSVLQPFDDRLFGLGADNAIYDIAVFENQQRGDARDLVTRGGHGIVVDV